MQKDIVTKETILAITYDIALYILKLDIKEDIEFIDKELKTIEKREADIVAICTIDGKKQILHIEIQNSNDYTMPRRMLRYYNDIKMKYPDTKINQFVIYIGKEKLKKAEDMLRTTRYEDLPSYEIGMERGISQGISQGIIQTATMMIKEFNMDAKEVSKKLNLPLDELMSRLKG